MSDKYVKLVGASKNKITKTVTIIAKEDKPLELKPNHFTLEKKVSYWIEEVQKGKVFNIHFASIPGVTGKHYGFLKLKTNYPEKPEITITVRASFPKRDSKRKVGSSKR